MEEETTINDEYLLKKARHHNHYKHYSKEYVIKNILDYKIINLMHGEEWNDLADKNNEAKRGIAEYSMCFSYAKEESVAMWMLYQGAEKNGMMIDFCQKIMTNIIDKKENNIVKLIPKNNAKNNNGYDVKSYNICLKDVLYKTKNGCYHSEEYIDSKTKIDWKKQITKKYPWKYELECRLIVSINKKDFKNIENFNDYMISIDIEEAMKGYEEKLKNRTYYSPNYCYKEKRKYKESELTGDVNWSFEKNASKDKSIKENLKIINSIYGK